MKTISNSVKCMIAMFMMTMAFALTGITAQAAINPGIVKDISVLPNAQMIVKDFKAGDTTIQETINVPAKGMIYIVAMANTNVTMTIGGINSTLSVPNSVTAVSKQFLVQKKGTYALNITRSSYAANSEGRLAFYVYFFNSEGSSISKDQIAGYYSQSPNDPTYTKISVKSTGYIGVIAQESNGYFVKVTLCNSKKKAVSQELYTSQTMGSIVYFAVTKGTYYIKTSSVTGGLYDIMYKFQKVKEKSGSKKSKAVTIKAGKTVKGVLTANNKSQSDWYKVKLSKKKTLKLLVASRNTDDDLRIKLIPASKRVRVLSGGTFLLKSNYKNIWKFKKVPAGTYYIQVTKKNKKSSGYYSIKFYK